MRLRWKTFLLLLVVSLVPMAIVTAISLKTSKNLGKSISTEIHKTLAESVKRELVSATENYAMITLRAKSSMELALQVLVRDAAAALARPIPPAGPDSIYFASDFDDVQTAPKDLTPSSVHMTILADGSLVHKQVSYDHPNFLVAPGVPQNYVRDDIARFSRLSPTLKAIGRELQDGLFWIYASLESGVHISYPGHGGYPADYDPRVRPWYQIAQRSGKVSWSPPIVDITTRQMTFTVSAPFFKPDGSFAGAAAIDVLLPNVLLQSWISSQWSSRMQPFLVGLSDGPGSGKDLVWVLSSKEKRDIDGHPVVNTSELLDFPEGRNDFSLFLKRLRQKKSGSLEMPYRGVDSFWAFAAIFPELYFVIVTPKSTVMGLPEAVSQTFADYTRTQMLISLSAVVIALFFIGALALFISEKDTDNVLAIVKGIRRLEKGDFTTRLDVHFKDERDQIVTAFNQIVPRLEEHLDMRRALGLAKDVQQSLLPKTNPVVQGFDIAGTSVYCDETGGDYYDFINIRHGKLAVVVGDVSGHGISSALLMATARALIMLRASMPGRAASIINDVNRHLSLDTYDTGNFMTFFYCELAPASREICWVRAGHDPAIMYDPDSDTFQVLKGEGPAFGLDFSFAYEEFHHTLTDRQIVLIGTDGIWEMVNEDGDMFGKKRLLEILRTHHAASAEEIIAIILDALKVFRGSQQAADDVTMVILKVEPPA